MDVPLSWLIIALCVFGSFFFSACETAFAGVNRFKMQVEADEGKKTAGMVLRVCEKFDRTLITVLIGNNIVAIIASSVSTVLFYHMLISSGFTNEVISLLSSIVVSLLFYILGDTFPKTIAKSIPDTLSKILVYPLYVLVIIFFPISYLFEKLTDLIQKTFKVKEEIFDEEDFEDVVEKVSDEGIIEEEQGEIIQSALEFADTNVKEVLTPREKIFALDINKLDKEKLHQTIISSPYSRIPIYRDDFDHIVGVLRVKTYLSAILKNPNVSFRKILQKPYFVHSDIMIDDLFAGFKKNHTHIALVKNKDKKIIGMVTMDDVLEELVSDISEPTQVKGIK